MGDDDTFAGRGTLAFQPNDDLGVTLSFNIASSDVATGPYQSIPTIGVFDTAGELINVINVGPNETRASIAGDGSDMGSDLNNDGMFGDSFGRPAGADFFGYIDPDGDDFTTSGDFAFEDHGELDTWGTMARFEYDFSPNTLFGAMLEERRRIG